MTARAATSSAPRRTGVLLAVALLAVVLLLGACGLGAQDDPQVIAGDDVPHGLLDPAPTTTTSTTRPGAVVTTSLAPLERVPLYFVRNDRIELCVREVETRPGMLDRVLLLDGPLEAREVELGFRSAVPEDSVLGVDDTEGYAIVDLDSSFTDLPTTREQVLAFAQITYTLTDLPGIGQVAFTLNGNPVLALDQQGIVMQGNRVSRATYQDLLASSSGQSACR